MEGTIIASQNLKIFERNRDIFGNCYSRVAGEASEEDPESVF